MVVGNVSKRFLFGYRDSQQRKKERFQQVIDSQVHRFSELGRTIVAKLLLNRPAILLQIGSGMLLISGMLISGMAHLWLLSYLDYRMPYFLAYFGVLEEVTVVRQVSRPGKQYRKRLCSTKVIVIVILIDEPYANQRRVVKQHKWQQVFRPKLIPSGNTL